LSTRTLAPPLLFNTLLGHLRIVMPDCYRRSGTQQEIAHPLGEAPAATVPGKSQPVALFIPEPRGAALPGGTSAAA
jgi:hypothetical protein